MREWERTTQRCEWEQIPAAAIAAYAELHGCSDLGAGVMACVQTDSVPFRRRIGRKPAPQRVVIAITPRYLVWWSDDAISAARVAGLEAHEYRSDLIEDSGLEVTGFRLGASERESWFLPLDDGFDGRRFRKALSDAVAAG